MKMIEKLAEEVSKQGYSKLGSRSAVVVHNGDKYAVLETPVQSRNSSREWMRKDYLKNGKRIGKAHLGFEVEAASA